MLVVGIDFPTDVDFIQFAKENVYGTLKPLMHLIIVAIQMIEAKKLGFGRIVSKVNEEK